MIRKIIKYRILIFQAIYFLCKYMLVRVLLSSKALIKFISDREDKKHIHYITRKRKQPFPSLLKSINRILNFVYPNGNCLVKSLVKRDMLQKYGFYEQIAIGVVSSEQGIKAHAWLPVEFNSNFKIVYLL